MVGFEAMKFQRLGPLVTCFSSASQRLYVLGPDSLVCILTSLDVLHASHHTSSKSASRIGAPSDSGGGVLPVVLKVLEDSTTVIIVDYPIGKGLCVEYMNKQLRWVRRGLITRERVKLDPCSY